MRSGVTLPTTQKVIEEQHQHADMLYSFWIHLDRLVYYYKALRRPGPRCLWKVHHGRFISVLAIAKKRVVICTGKFGGGHMEKDTHCVSKMARGQ
jgi:hypothetical protein